jgi:UDP-glucose 4-epimerase
MPCILLTGATGYIGSHTWLALLQAGYDVVGLDNLVNSSPRVIQRIEALSGRSAQWVQGDARDAAVLDRLFTQQPIDATIHFAALKAVGDSEREPLAYWDNNVVALTRVAQAMQRHGCNNMVFSSSATVYGTSQNLPLDEHEPLAPFNVYGHTKAVCEQVLTSLAAAQSTWRNAILRYFNPVGAHDSGEMGEDPQGVPNNLMPYIAQVAVGRRDKLRVFGNDYATPDGTGVRDYIHVMDLAEGHVAALGHVLRGGDSVTVNLGTGRGHSVLELLAAYQAASGRPLAHEFAPRRDGDIAACYAKVDRARALLGWQAKRDLRTMCEDSWRWQSRYPLGFADPAAGLSTSQP